MTLAEKLGMLVLRFGDGYENIDSGVPRLCIPPLTLSDGSNGISFHTPGATQLPASIGVAATFDPSVAFRYGQLEGAEARTKGIDVVQAPELNLARVPESGRIFEAYGEDPTLTAEMGVADIEGIQSKGVMADATHFTAYNEETARLRLNQVVPDRALQEIYDLPFEAAVEQGRVASVMCAYGELDGINQCSDPKLYATLYGWGFDGFVRSDLEAVRDPAAAFRAGIDLIKPASVAELEALVQSGVLPIGDVDRAVEAVLQEMFAFGIVARPSSFDPDAPTDSPARQAVARWVAERSMVLLQDRQGILPLSRRLRSLAVIGVDAGPDPMSAGFGSAHVESDAVVSPLDGLARALPGTRLAYAPGGPEISQLPPLTSAELAAGQPLAPRRRHRHRLHRVTVEPGTGDLDITAAHNVAPAELTASAPGRGPGWDRWSAVLQVPESGLYELSLFQEGDTWCTLDGRPLLSMPGLHGHAVWATTVHLSAGRRYRLALRWFQTTNGRPPRIGLEDVSPQIAEAVRAARAAQVAVVFVNDWSAEGVDRPSLDLPGDANALISAVAAANPRTVVVLNTGGAVLMPWRNQVQGILEAWYPGEQDGPATAAVLTGRVDPAGRLPLTFPASARQTPLAGPSAYPGVDGTVVYREGLDVGYRWYLATGRQPLFPFGFGLSYTSFSLGDASLATVGSAVQVSVRVRNTGGREGTDVVECYLADPADAGEPPEQLRAFATVTLRPGTARRVTLTLERSAFEADLGGAMQTVPGTYEVALGPNSEQLPIRLPVSAP